MDWHSVDDAYGPADEVPRLLAALCSQDPHERKIAEGDWFNRLDHQGSVYSATGLAIRTLAAATKDGAIDLWTGLWLIAVTTIDAALQAKRSVELRESRGETAEAAATVLEQVRSAAAGLRSRAEDGGQRELAAAALLSVGAGVDPDVTGDWLRNATARSPLGPIRLYWLVIDDLLHGRHIAEDVRADVWADTFAGPVPSSDEWTDLDVARELFINVTGDGD